MRKRRIRFTLLVNEQERKTITELAKRMQRTQSDAVRFLIRQASQSQQITEVQTDGN